MQSGGIKPVCKVGINENKGLFLEKSPGFVTLCNEQKKKCVKSVFILEKYIHIYISVYIYIPRSCLCCVCMCRDVLNQFNHSFNS